MDVLFNGLRIDKPYKCPLCGKNVQFKNHEKDCPKLSGLHIHVHNAMVSYLLRKLKKYHAREVLEKNYNLLPGHAKPDIFVTYKNVTYYMDIGFSNNAASYAKDKKERYKDTPHKVDFVLF